MSVGHQVGVLVLSGLLLSGCATGTRDDADSRTAAGVVSMAPGAHPWPAPESDAVPGADNNTAWVHQTLPGKRATEIRYVRMDGRDAVAVQSSAAASLLRHRLRLEPTELGQLKFSWKVPALIAGADLAVRDRADSPARVILAFDGDRSRLSMKDAMLSELARTLTGEELPYATLMYVWCNVRAPESVIHSARTDRIRKIVVESGPRRLNGWLDYERDVRADYQRAFGEAPGALIGIAIMTDTDNTKSTARAFYGPVSLRH